MGIVTFIMNAPPRPILPEHRVLARALDAFTRALDRASVPPHGHPAIVRLFRKLVRCYPPLRPALFRRSPAAFLRWLHSTSGADAALYRLILDLGQSCEQSNGEIQ